MSSDYSRVEHAIRFLDEYRERRPSLADVAAEVGLSEFHFQRIFTRWAGISPKRFLQFQTLAHARALLRDSHSVLDATYDAGLSGPARLHDLLVTIDAVTPGEVRRLGAGLTIEYGIHPTAFGDALLALTERGVCALFFVDAGAGGRAGAMRQLEAQWPGALLRANPEATEPVVRRIFARSESPENRVADPTTLRVGAPLPLLVRGTNFQVKVWEALLRVPEGAVIAYEALAGAVGAPGATRAVASAVARNPVAYLIPCHRVIRKTGAFGEYRWGSARKRAMLGWEAARGADERRRIELTAAAS
jgi:AraC family transcriptional regulator, regulatory protein of adaptative response / methylated-DNA-[protein]-cysteine methyltransferase